MYNTIPHAIIDLPNPEVHAKHPLRNKDTHDQLLDYIKPRLAAGRDARDQRLPRMVRADKSVAGWMKMNQDDKDRVRKEEKDGIPQAVTMNLPLSFVQIDDMMTYYSQTFAPNRGMFYQMGKPDEKTPASQIVTLMNNHAVYAGYYRHVLQTTFATLKYNCGGFFCEWAKDYGPKMTQDAQGKPAVTNNQVIWSGNKVESLDMYNTFWDPMVNPANVYKDGEWCSRTKLVSHYWLQQKAAQGIYFNVREALDNDSGVGTAVYYRSPPAEARLGADSTSGNDTNWVAFLSNNEGYMSQTGFELTEIYIKLNPVQLNLVPRTREAIRTRNQYEIWRITLLNDTTIVDTTLMNNMHGFLPFFMGLLHDDGMGINAKSVAEILKPLQDFASFLMNTHVRATRKNIWGLTVYDPTMVDLAQVPEGEVAARIAAKPSATGKDLRQSVVSLADHQLDTKQTMQDLASTMEIINQFFPTTSLPSQIASIDRAVDSQVAAVQQGANRRMQKGARLLDELMFRPLRFALYYNILQYQQDEAVVNDFYGRQVTIDLSQIRATDLPFIIGQGLKAIDRQAAAGQMQNIIFALVQNPATAERVDFMAMIDYWTSMIDIDIDMTQFAIQPPPTTAPGPGGEAVPGAEGGPAPPVVPTE